jgi:hypothetical protein
VAASLEWQDDEQSVVTLDPSNGLVPEDQRWHSLAAGAAIRVQVGAADSREGDLEQGLIGVGDLTREILDYETIASKPHERFHTSS